ncbi:DUF889-domain-containing protein, partial [Schizophyllum commune Tattone D]
MCTRSEDTFLASVYPNLNGPFIPSHTYFAERMILAPRNKDVDALNAALLHQMPGEVVAYHSADTVEHEAGADGPDNIPPEFLRTIDASSLPPGELSLKARILGGDHDGETALIPRI